MPNHQPVRYSSHDSVVFAPPGNNSGAAHEAAMNQIRARQRTGLRILVAEDEPLVAMVIEEALLDFGHSVLLATDGEQAIRLAGEAGFDVLVTDLNMPRLTGWELIPRLWAQRPGLPVVVMTGFLPLAKWDELLADQRGPLALVLKPFEVTQLAATAERVAAASCTGNPAAASTALLELS